jgi:hypothetical protein
MKRGEWLHLARKLDWDFSYVREQDVFPLEVSGRPRLPHEAWSDCDEPYKTTYAYTYRASVWFDLVVPGPDEPAWLRDKYPASWPSLERVWQPIADRWREADPGNDFAVHGTAISDSASCVSWSCATEPLTATPR